MPMTIPGVYVAPRGDNKARPLQDWVSQVLRNLKPMFNPLPVMDNPPVLTLAKGTGISSVAIVAGGSGYVAGNILTVTGGASSAVGMLRVVRVDEAGAVTAAAVEMPGIYSEKPENPVTVTTTGAGAGATFNLGFNAGVASSIAEGVTWSRAGDGFTYLGSDVKDSSPGYRGNGVGNGTQFIAQFVSDAPDIDIRLLGANTQLELYIDGQRSSTESIRTDSSGAPFVLTVDFNGVNRPRLYELVGVNSAFGGVILPRQWSVWRPAEWRPFVWQLGDSYTFGNGATQPSFNDFRITCDNLNFEGLADGIGGTGWTSTGSRQPQERIKTKLATLSRLPEYVFLSLGYNDAPGGNIDLLKTNFAESVELVREICPLAKIVVFGPATPAGSTVQLDAVRDALIEQCKALDLLFIDVKDWVNARNRTIYTVGDNVHPSDAGYAYRATRITESLIEAF